MQLGMLLLHCLFCIDGAATHFILFGSTHLKWRPCILTCCWHTADHILYVHHIARDTNTTKLFPKELAGRTKQLFLSFVFLRPGRLRPNEDFPAPNFTKDFLYTFD